MRYMTLYNRCVTITKKENPRAALTTLTNQTKCANMENQK